MNPSAIAINHLASLIQVENTSRINGRYEVVLLLKEGANVLHRHLCVVETNGDVSLSTSLLMESHHAN